MLLFELELFLLFLEMPPKSKRKRKLEERLQKGRDVKRNRQGTSSAAVSGEDVEQVYGDVVCHRRLWILIMRLLILPLTWKLVW